jgi:cytidylate kinase
MDQIETLKRYLKISAHEPASRRRPAPKGPMPFVTISRESGAGGRLLAQMLQDELDARTGNTVFEDWSVFDSALCERVASDPELNVGLRELLDESSLNAAEDMVAVLLGKSPQREIHLKVTEIIRELAMVGRSIIIGRGGASITRDLATGVHVRLVAPLSVRVERAAAGSGISIKETTKTIRESDRNRATFVRRLCDHDIDSALLYDAVYNTERTPIDMIASGIADWIERLAQTA